MGNYKQVEILREIKSIVDAAINNSKYVLHSRSDYTWEFNRIKNLVEKK